jgi:hypothetical protein
MNTIAPERLDAIEQVEAALNMSVAEQRELIRGYRLYQAWLAGELRGLSVMPFQERIAIWMGECFGPEVSADTVERNHRFLEEALELVQACGCSAADAHALVDYTFSRPVGERAQEVGGVMVTLAALCLAHGLDMQACGETERQRIWTKIEEIRAKQAAKPRGSAAPLPSVAQPPAGDDDWSAPPPAVLDTLVNRFLGWRLPDDFAPDGGVRFTPPRAEYMPHEWPVGTNLLTDPQARAMFSHCLQDEVTRLLLCEAGKLHLRPGVLHYFHVDPNCEACRKAAAKYDPVDPLSAHE